MTINKMEDKFYKDMVALETQKIEKEFTEHVTLLQKMVHDKIKDKECNLCDYKCSKESDYKK